MQSDTDSSKEENDVTTTAGDVKHGGDEHPRLEWFRAWIYRGFLAIGGMVTAHFVMYGDCGRWSLQTGAALALLFLGTDALEFWMNARAGKSRLTKLGMASLVFMALTILTVSPYLLALVPGVGAWMVEQINELPPNALALVGGWFWLCQNCLVPELAAVLALLAIRSLVRYGAPSAMPPPSSPRPQNSKQD